MPVIGRGGALRRLAERRRAHGTAATARAAMAFLARETSRGWRRWQVRYRPLTLDAARLARALGVEERQLPAAVAQWRRELGERLPIGPDAVPAIRTALATHAPAELEAYRRAADAISAHVFDLLGSGRTELGPEIDWHCDFKTGHRWQPTVFWADVPIRAAAGADIKVPWELSRGHHLVTLAQAAALLGDDAYAGEAAAQIRHWIAHNPTERGVNWRCPMDVAIRAVNWLWALSLLSRMPSIDDELYAESLPSLIAHGRFIRRNLEVIPGSPSHNHLLADLVGLLYVALCVRECQEAAAWRAFALEHLQSELRTQVHEDGPDFESSIPYHRLVAEMFLSSVAICRRNGVSLAPESLERIDAMVAFTAAYTKPNGLAPQLGDADDGRLHVLTGYGSADPQDHRHILAAGGWLFSRPEWHVWSGPSWTEALWWGAAGRKPWGSPPDGTGPARTSTAFPAAGIYILRRASHYVLFACGDVGTAGLGNHKHNDALSIQVSLDGEDLIVDPGTFTYTADPALRQRLRATLAHATVTVDGEEQNRFVPDELFTMCRDAVPRVIEWRPGASADRIEAEHSGYQRLAAPVTHRRSVVLDHESGHVLVDDALAPADGTRTREHEAIWTLPLAAGLQPECDPGDGSCWTIRTPSAAMRLEIGAPTSGQLVRIGCDESWLSPSYGKRIASSVLRWTWRGVVPMRLTFSLKIANTT